MSTTQTDILISGGGITGLTLAILLTQAGMDVALIDPSAPKPLSRTKPSGRTVALMQSSLNIIKATGVWDRLENKAGPMKAMRIIDISRGPQTPVESYFPAGDIGLAEYGFNIPNSLLRSALYDRAKKAGVTLLVPEKLDSHKAENAIVISRLESGKEIRARLLIGADGRNSTVRNIAGIKTRTKAYHQSAITCLINHSRSHDHSSTEFHRPAGPLALVPLPGNQSSVVWVESEERAQKIVALKKSEFEQTLRDYTNDILGGITLEEGPACWPLTSIKAATLTAPRMALMAEAAHVISPITAQGLNLSLRDVATLAETVADALRLGLDYGSPEILRKYEKRRMIDINTRVLGVNSINRIVSTDAETVKGLRRAGLKFMDSCEPLKKFAARQVLAPEIDQGRLARGQAL